MINTDEDALICDLAETYHIYDYRQLPALRVAVFSCGLQENSRIKMRMNNQKAPLATILLAGIFDKVSMLLWLNTKDSQSNKNRPELVAPTLIEQLASSGKKRINCLRIW